MTERHHHHNEQVGEEHHAGQEQQSERNRRERLREECQRQVERYQGQFPEIPPMTSAELVKRWRRQQTGGQSRKDNFNNDVNHADIDHDIENDDIENDDIENDDDDDCEMVLIDVRTEAERSVSMIPGAITMREFERRHQQQRSCSHQLRRQQQHQHQQQNQPTPPTDTCGNNKQKVLVVTYCTVGYRSGREARRLLDLHPQYEGRVRNLDGIVAYTHVRNAPPLVVVQVQGSSSNRDAETAAATRQQVHTYGRVWGDLVDPDSDYDAVWFDDNGGGGRWRCCCCFCCSAFVRRLAVTVCASVGRWCQHAAAVTVTATAATACRRQSAAASGQ